MHDYGHYALLVCRIQSFPSLHLYLVFCSCIIPPKTKFANSVHHIYLFVVFHCHSFVVCSFATFKNFKNSIACFVKLLAHGGSLSCIVVRYPCWHGDAIKLTFLVEYHVSCYACSSYLN